MKENISADVAKPRKIALYLSIKHGWYSLWEPIFSEYDEHYTKLSEPREVPRADYIRCSEIMEVSFRPISDDQVVANAVDALNEAERAVLRELNEKLTEIRERKAQLLSLSHQSEET